MSDWNKTIQSEELSRPEPDAGVSFDPKRPFTTRDGREVNSFREDRFGINGKLRGYSGMVRHSTMGFYVKVWWHPNGQWLLSGNDVLDLVNVVSPPSTPEPADAGQVEGEAVLDLRSSASRFITSKGWKPGDKLSVASVLALVTSFAAYAQKVTPLVCAYPECGCDADAMCAEAVARRGASLPASSAPQVDALEGAELDDPLYWLLKLVEAADGSTDASDYPGHPLNVFCNDRGKKTDTFNIASDRGLIRVSHNNLDETSLAEITEDGRSALYAETARRAAPPPCPDPATDGGWREAILTEREACAQECDRHAIGAAHAHDQAKSEKQRTIFEARAGMAQTISAAIRALPARTPPPASTGTEAGR